MARFSLRRNKRATEAQQEDTGPASDAKPTASGGRPQEGAAPGQAGQSPSGQPAAASREAAQAPTGQQAAPEREPTLPERVEGLRSWLAQLDRRIGVRTYAGAAALVLALAAAAVALVLVLQLQDESATDGDIAELREEIAGVEDAASEAAQEDVASLSDRVAEIDSQISQIASDQESTGREISVIQDDIQDLRDQIAEADTGSAGGSGGGGVANSP